MHRFFKQKVDFLTQKSFFIAHDPIETCCITKDEIKIRTIYLVYTLSVRIVLDNLRDLVPFVQLKNVKIPYIEEASARTFTKSSTPPWVFFHDFYIIQTCNKFLTKHRIYFMKALMTKDEIF